ncbi:mucin-5AC-like isoform X8 [Anopheles albimanus]|uniref:mucin-5AC-like isoform X8 n=1 Tax=Anopheles albimanus TaxID=7167 RepID=UPI00163E2745|nr:mucin-5AC-like isoform X8 [Anopheles albimanus]
MDIGMDRGGPVDAGVATIGTLFQHIVNDMKNSSPLWEDFIAKATKLHACLRAAIQALAAYLDAFQKIADAATNSRGATKEIGTALTRVCLRHKAVESRMKTFTSAIMDCLIGPLQEKLEDWRKQVTVIDKDHAKEYKRCRAELKKRSSDTLRLQKKAKKGLQADNNLHVLVENSMQDVTLRRCELEEVERKSLRAIMVEERTRYCTFVSLLQPVVHEECEVMSELGHLQEAMQLIAAVTKDPAQLPQASEELILESKANIGLYPDSPGGSNSQGGCSNSLGSRKSSVCSISSINSSSSGSPGHHHQFQRSLSQYSPAIRLKPGESSDSGFCSSPALTSQASTLASQSHAVSTWPPHTQDATSTVDRPHTISSAYEKGHQRPALTVYTFQSPETIVETSTNHPKSPANVACRPPLPVRCSSLERPLSTTSVKNANSNIPRQCPSPIPAHITKEHPQLQPTYVNMTELASMAASKTTNNSNNGINNNVNNNGGGTVPVAPAANQQQHHQMQQQHGHQHHGHGGGGGGGYQQLQQPNSPVLSSASSLISPDSNATNPISSPDASACSTQTPQNTPQTGSPGTPNYSGGGAINQGYRSTTPSSMAGGLFDPASTPCESNNDTSSNHTITIDDNDEHYSNNSTSTCAASISTTTNTNTTNNTTTTSTTTNKPSSAPHESSDYCSGTGGTATTISSSNTSTTTSTTTSSASITPGSSAKVDKDLLKRTGSVLEKTSMFEQQINNNQLHLQQPQPPPQQLSVPGSPANASLVYGRRTTHEEIYKSAGQLLLDRDAGPTRVTRRASVNTVKPPPPVRRSSSVTPSPSVGTNSITTTNLAQQSVAYTSSESLPPPPAYLLDSTAGSSPSISGNVAGTVKALNEIRHTPASPGVLRRAQQNNPPSNQGSPTPTNTNLYATLQPSKHDHTMIASSASSSALAAAASQHHHPSTPNSFHASDGNKSLSNRSPKTNLHQPGGGIYAQPKQLTSMSSFRNSSPAKQGPQKPNSGFLAQLNAKIAPNKPPPPGHGTASSTVYQHQQQQHQQQQHVQQPSNNYVYTTAPSGNELIYQRSTPVDPRMSYNNNQQQLHQQQQQQQYYQSQQQQQQQQQPIQPPPREGKSSIYSSASQSSSHQHQQQHYQQQQQQYYQNQYHQQQQQPQQQLQYQPTSQQYHYQHHQQPNAVSHRQQYAPATGGAAAGSYATQNIYVSTNPFASSVQTTATGGVGGGSSYSPSSFGKGGVRSGDDSVLGAGGGSSATSTPNRTNHHMRNNNGAAGGSSVGAAAGVASSVGPVTHNVLAKTSAGFLENLNARLAEQRLSGKAFAVRNLINSKALPDPRICHESLMDQIKRGATLKRNRTINDRSAPKIH